VVIAGVLTGLVYGLMALGLSVIFGVVRVVNFAHGEMMTVAMYAATALFATFKLDPFLAVPIFLALAAAREPHSRLRLANAVVLTVFAVLAGAAVFGEALLKFLGASLPAFQAPGRAPQRALGARIAEPPPGLTNSRTNNGGDPSKELNSPLFLPCSRPKQGMGLPTAPAVETLFKGIPWQSQS